MRVFLSAVTAAVVSAVLVANGIDPGWCIAASLAVGAAYGLWPRRK